MCLLLTQFVLWDFLGSLDEKPRAKFPGHAQTKQHRASPAVFGYKERLLLAVHMLPTPAGPRKAQEKERKKKKKKKTQQGHQDLFVLDFEMQFALSMHSWWWGVVALGVDNLVHWRFGNEHGPVNYCPVRST